MSEFDTVLRPALVRVPERIAPNHLTFLRAALLGPLIIAERLGYPWLAIAFLIGSSICDIVDGPLARYRRVTSNAGATLDATADKIFILGALGYLTACGYVYGIVLASAAIPDLALTFIRHYKKKHSVPTHSNMWGKRKVWPQSIGIGLVLLNHPIALLLAYAVFVPAFVFALFSIRGHLRDIRAAR